MKFHLLKDTVLVAGPVVNEGEQEELDSVLMQLKGITAKAVKLLDVDLLLLPRVIDVGGAEHDEALEHDAVDGCRAQDSQPRVVARSALVCDSNLVAIHVQVQDSLVQSF